MSSLAGKGSQGARFRMAKIWLSPLTKNFQDRDPFRLLDCCIHVAKCPAETRREQTADSRLACAHEADEKDFLREQPIPHEEKSSKA